MVIQLLGIHSVGGSNVCFADKKGVLLQAEVHLSRLISFKQLFCRAERLRGSGHGLHITQQAVGTEHGAVYTGIYVRLASQAEGEHVCAHFLPLLKCLDAH